MKRALFLDRDGVINKVIFRDGRPCSPRRLSEFEIISGVQHCLDRSRAAGLLNIVMTNQPDISRGMMDISELDAMHRRIRETLPVDEVLTCPHDDNDACDCRKPRPGMLLTAARTWDIDLKRSFAIGDQWKDMEAGKAAGCTTVLIDYPYNQDVRADVRVPDLPSALQTIKEVEASFSHG